MSQKYIFQVNGMHCQACVLLIESELKDLPNVREVKANLKLFSVEVTGDFGEKSEIEVAAELSKVLAPRGYSLEVAGGETKSRPFSRSKVWPLGTRKWADFKIAIPVALGFVFLFVALQKMGIVNLVSASEVSYGTAFIIGVIASLSSCMAVVGGLVLSMSATFAREGDKVRPQVLFHLGRIVAFFVLGGVIGVIGSAFTLNTLATFILNLVIGLVMLTLGINLLDTFHFAKRFQITTPKFISKHALGVTKMNHVLTPALVGIATFFLPCGFTQSMQIVALSTGSFFSGALTMLSFALGTLPVLAILSFSSLSIHNSSKSGIFFKSAGLIVILFAIFNLINSLVVIGLIPPIFNF